MSLRSRRAAAPVSSSASTTIRPPTMCSPPANRSSEATSALRQQVLVIAVLASSSFTCPVIAMAGSSHARQRGGTDSPTRSPPAPSSPARTTRSASASRTGSCALLPGWDGHVGDDQSRPQGLHGVLEVGPCRQHRGGVGEHGVRPAASGATSRSAARWSAGLKPPVSPACGHEVEHEHEPVAAVHDRPAQLGQQQVREHRGVPGARSEDHPVGGLDRSPAPRGRPAGPRGSAPPT